MIIVSDLEEPFLPLPYDLLVVLSESRRVVQSFLEKLPTLHANSGQTLSALGKALKSAEKLIVTISFLFKGAIGGKIIILQHSLPNHEEGSLKMRDDAKLYGTPKEASLLQPSTQFYKNYAVDCSPSQISIDVFLFNEQYSDLATICNFFNFDYH